MINHSGYNFQIGHCVTGTLWIQLALTLVWVFYPHSFISGVYTFLKKMSLPSNQNLLNAQKQAFRLLTLLCKCDRVHTSRT